MNHDTSLKRVVDAGVFDVLSGGIFHQMPVKRIAPQMPGLSHLIRFNGIDKSFTAVSVPTVMDLQREAVVFRAMTQSVPSAQGKLQAGV